MSRDTHFQQFAKVLYEELQHEDTKARDSRLPYNHMEVQCKIIAQRAYDLVSHTIESVEPINLVRLSLDEHVERIPDEPCSMIFGRENEKNKAQ